MKIKESFRLLFVLGISILLMLAETAGSFFSKSLSLLSYAGLIVSFAFSALPLIIRQDLNIYDQEGFRRSQFYSIFFNCIMLLAIAAYIIYKAFAMPPVPRGIDIFLTCLTASFAFAGLTACLLLLYKDKNKNIFFKKLFLKFLFCLILSPVIIISSALYYFKDMRFLDSAISVCIAVFIIIQAFFLLKQAKLALN